MNLEQIYACRTEGCENRVENPDTMLCASCGHAMRKAARRAAMVQVVQPIRKVSKKLARELQDYSVLRKIHLQEYPECQVRIENICDGQATTIHHEAKRGINLLNAETFRSACGPCHIYLETVMSAEERREKGLLKTVEGTI